MLEHFETLPSQESDGKEGGDWLVRIFSCLSTNVFSNGRHRRPRRQTDVLQRQRSWKT